MFTGKFYQTYREKLISILFILFQKCQRKKEIPKISNSFNEAMITLISDKDITQKEKNRLITPLNITVIQVHARTSNAEEADVDWFYEDLQDLLELTTKKDGLFIIGDGNARVGSQETPGVIGKFGLGVKNEEGQRLIEFCQENTLVTANTLFQQHKRKLYTWTSPGGQYRNQTDYTLCSQRWRSSIQSAKTRLAKDHELLIAKLPKLKKVGKTMRPFRYDLNQIPYNYTVEVTTRFNRLDLIDRVSEELWAEVRDIVQEAEIKTIHKEKK